MPSAYINSLNSSLQTHSVGPHLSSPSLKQRLIVWFESQPEISRCRPYSMMELERVLGTQGRFLSPILLGLGWERRRKWSNTGQSHRYWVPPGC